MIDKRERLPNRRASETFVVETAGLGYTATVSYFDDGRIAELFLSNHKSGSSADTNARDAAVTFSIAIQCGADADVIRKALCRDSQGHALGPLGAALDLLFGEPMSMKQDRAAIVTRAIKQTIVGKCPTPGLVEAVRSAQPEIESYLRDEFADVVRQTLADTRLRDL
jgi:ribonucleoside-diphosphate reductase alpha chain